MLPIDGFSQVLSVPFLLEQYVSSPSMDGIFFPIVNLVYMQYDTNLVPDQPNDSKGLVLYSTGSSS